MVLGVLLVGLQQIVVDVLRAQLGLDAIEVERLEFLHHQGSGGVLGERLVDPDRDLLARFHPAVEEVCTDDLAGDSVRHR